MERCRAVAVRTNERCKLDAIVDADGDSVLDSCIHESHQKQVRERAATDSLASSVAKGEDSRADDRGVPAQESEDRKGNPVTIELEHAAGPVEQLEPVAAPGPSIEELQAVSAGLFKDEQLDELELDELGEPKSQPGSAEPASTSPGAPGAALVSRGHWTPQRVKRWIRGPVELANEFYEDSGIDDRVDDADVDWLAEDLAPAFDDFLSKVDPNNPYGLAFLTIAFVFGPPTFSAVRARMRRARALKARGPQIVREEFARTARDVRAPQQQQPTEPDVAPGDGPVDFMGDQ